MVIGVVAVFGSFGPVIAISALPGNLTQTFAAGDRVTHNVFGEGTVAAAKQMGNDCMLTINFDNGQQKKLMANFARIKKI